MSANDVPLRADARRNRAAILTAAATAFAQHGPAATTQQVADRAGVAVGTVFRHFPTKEALLAAIMKESLRRLTDQAQDTDLFGFITAVVDQAATTRTVVDALAGQGVDVEVAGALRQLQDATADLLDRGQQSGAVRPEIRLDEVMALLTAAAHGALHADWEPDLRHRTLAVVFTGLRASPA